MKLGAGLQNCTDNLGYKYMSKEEAARVFEYELPEDEEARQKILEGKKYEDDLKSSVPESERPGGSQKYSSKSDQMLWLLYTRGIPEESFSVNPSLIQDIDQYIKELNQFGTEPGEFYDKSKNKAGEDIIIKGTKPFLVPTAIPDLESNFLKLRSKAVEAMQKELNYTTAEAEREINQFFINGNFSDKMLSQMKHDLQSKRFSD